MGQYLRSGRKAEQNSLVTILRNKKVEVSDIQAITLTDLSGTILASTATDLNGQKVSGYGIAPGQDTSITVKEDARDGINKLYINTRTSVNKQETGVVSVVFRIDDIVAAVQDYTGLGATGETVVIEKTANQQAITLFPLRFNTDAALKINLTGMQLFSHGDTAYHNVQDYRGQQVLVAARSIGFANWIIATKIDRAEALAPIMQLRNSLLAMDIIASLIIITIALYFARFFTEPILRIIRATQRIGMGDFTAHLDLRRRDEIGILAQNINAMGVSLNEFVASIEAQRHRLEIILNSTEECIVAINKKGDIIIANKVTAELTGKSIKDLVGMSIDDVFVWMRDEQPFTINYETNGTTAYREVQYTNDAGTTYYVDLVVAQVGDGQDQQAQTIITIHDQTKSRELENMKLDFVSMAAHELRTPLAAIKGYLQFILYMGNQNSVGAIEEYLQQALKSTTQLGGLINNLLDITRIEHGTLTLTLEKIDLADNVNQALRDASFSAKDKNIELHYEGAASDCFVAADQIALREVINNLLANAIKYTNNNGRIGVTLTRKAKTYVVSFKDNGIGIPKHALPNLFTKFYRVHGGLNSGSAGTGLGLFIAKSIIERLEGTISVDSQEGVGSVFTFTLPVLSSKRFAEIQKIQSHATNTRRKHGWITKNIARRR